MTELNEKDYIGISTVTNTLALLIINIDEVEEKVEYRFSNDIATRKAKIYTTTKGRSYFKIRGVRHYLDEFVRATF